MGTTTDPDSTPIFALKSANINGVTIAFVDEPPVPIEANAGKRVRVDNSDDDGTTQTVLLLHGWPDSSYLWRHQIKALSDAGFRVVAPDLRGFGQSSMPADVAAYAITNSMLDVISLLDHLEIAKVKLVGHDWGSVLAWVVAAFLPERVEKLVAISVGHPTSFASAGLEQLSRSWYTFWFQFPGVAEAALPREDWKLLREFLGNEGDIEKYVSDLGRPGALTASLNWYRANMPPERVGASDPPLIPNVSCPTLGIWSDRDFALVERQMTHSEVFVDGPWEYLRLGGIGHHVPVLAPERLNEVLLGYFRD